MPVTINWNSTPEKWIGQLDTVYDRYDQRSTILAGHWLGALVAFLSAAIRNPSALWLFSLPPFFNEDMPINPRLLKNTGVPPEVFGDILFASNARFVKCKTVLFVGSDESQASLRRTRETEQLLPKAQRIIVSGSYNHVAKPHTSYVASIKRSL